MKIKSKTMIFAGIPPGQIFTMEPIESIAENGPYNKYYLKMDDNITGDVNAVNLTNGVQCMIPPDKLVYII